MKSLAIHACTPSQAVRLHVDGDSFIEFSQDLPLILVLAVTKNFVSCDEVADDYFWIGSFRRFGRVIRAANIKAE